MADTAPSEEAPTPDPPMPLAVRPQVTPLRRPPRIFRTIREWIQNRLMAVVTALGELLFLFAFVLAVILGSIFVLNNRIINQTVRTPSVMPGGTYAPDGRAQYSAGASGKAFAIAFVDGVARKPIPIAASGLALPAVRPKLADEAKAENALRDAANAAANALFTGSADTKAALSAPILSGKLLGQLQAAKAGGNQGDIVIPTRGTGPPPTPAARPPTQTPPPTNTPVADAATPTTAPTKPAGTSTPPGGNASPTPPPAPPTNSPAPSATPAPQVTATPVPVVTNSPVPTITVAPSSTAPPHHRSFSNRTAGLPKPECRPHHAYGAHPAIGHRTGCLADVQRAPDTVGRADRRRVPDLRNLTHLCVLTDHYRDHHADRDPDGNPHPDPHPGRRTVPHCACGRRLLHVGGNPGPTGDHEFPRHLQRCQRIVFRHRWRRFRHPCADRNRPQPAVSTDPPLCQWWDEADRLPAVRRRVYTSRRY